MRSKYILGLLVGILLTSHGIYQVYNAVCMYNDFNFVVGDATILGYFTKLTSQKKLFQIVDYPNHTLFLSKVSITQDFIKACSYIGSNNNHNVVLYNELLVDLKLAFKHNILLTIDKQNDSVLFSTFTHSPKIWSKLGSSITKIVSGVDLTGLNRLQMLSDTFLMMSVKDFEIYLKSGAISIEELNINLIAEDWINNKKHIERLNNLSEQNIITQNIVKKYNSSFVEKTLAPNLKIITNNSDSSVYYVNNKQIGLLEFVKNASTTVIKKIK